MRLLRLACLLGLFGTACVGKGADPSDDGAGGSGSDWGARTDVQAILQADCATCHSSQWSSCWSVHEDASDVASLIQADAMPRGTPMAPADKSTVLAWLAQGAPCSGDEPDGGGLVWTSGAPRQ